MQKEQYIKEGALKGDLGQFIMIVVGVGASVLLLIFLGLLGGQAYDLTEADLDTIGVYTETNNEITALNSTAVSLTRTGLLANPTVTKAGVTITGNFTYDLNAGTATLIDNANNNTAVNMTYNWQNATVSGHIKRSILTGFTALEDTAGFMPLIITAIVITFVLTIVLMLGMGKGGSGKFSAL